MLFGSGCYKNNGDGGGLVADNADTGGAGKRGRNPFPLCLPEADWKAAGAKCTATAAAKAAAITTTSTGARGGRCSSKAPARGCNGLKVEKVDDLDGAAAVIQRVADTIERLQRYRAGLGCLSFSASKRVSVTEFQCECR